MYYEYLVENFGPQTKSASMEKSALSTDLIRRAIASMKKAPIDRIINRTNGRVKGWDWHRSFQHDGNLGRLRLLNLYSHPDIIGQSYRSTSPSANRFLLDSGMDLLASGKGNAEYIKGGLRKLL